ncbi:F-box domain, cyclin-like protein [Artemisia annua]|uniref:F-box domain, cyclin-like protein n=1 Tax=Artemisia annua TaxID=35608 RepID=A0A2U1KAS4_ARTAN|nr:F-box domain, cyclin-like protein [Artemisia annua]
MTTYVSLRRGFIMGELCYPSTLLLTNAQNQIQMGLTFHQCEVEDRGSLKLSDDVSAQPEFPFKEDADIMPSGPAHSDKDYLLESGNMMVGCIC